MSYLVNRQKLKKVKENNLHGIQYSMQYWEDFDYSILDNIMYRIPNGKRKDRRSYNEIVIMLDTETSKTKENEYDDKGKIIPVDNIIVCWSIALRAYGRNIITLYGRKPSDISKCLQDIHFNMNGDKTFIFVHNLAYDWVFMRKFLMQDLGEPKNQLNTKPHYPLTIEFGDGIILRDSLILAQRSLEKWGKDLNVEHSKAIGSWDYSRIRTQATELSTEELHYIEHDVLCGVECIDTLMGNLKKNIITLPYTATGIPREQVRKLGKKNSAHDKFLKICPDYETHKKLEQCYHGGFTHGNRHFINTTMENVQGFDFASSYPYCMLSEKFPLSKFQIIEEPMTVDEVLELKDQYGFIVRLIALNVIIKNEFLPMPPLQFSKCIKSVNAELDNGRILSANLVEIWLTETDLEVINDNYNWSSAVCVDVEYSFKKYLPKWFTDYIYQCFVNKTKLKGGDPVAYALSKSIINALY